MKTQNEATTGDIRVVIFHEGGQWVAQCLEYDIGVQAADFATLRTRLRVVIEAERRESMSRGGKPFEGIPPAPQHFHEMWEKQTSTISVDDEPKGGDDQPFELQFGIAA